jgi:DNA excision repair protein ERCC-6
MGLGGGGLGRGRAFSGQLAGTTGGAAPSSAALLAQLRQRQASIAAAEAGVPGPRRFGGPGSGSGSPGVGVSPQASPPAAAAAGLGAAAPVGATRQLQGRGYSEGDEQTPEPLASAAAAAAGGGGLAGQIAGFIQAAGGSATSDALVSHFGGVLEPEEMPLFKQVLRQVAKLQAAGSGQGKVWVLKQGGSTGQ